MEPMYYIGLDVHKQKISYCVKDTGSNVYAEGWIPATRFDLDRWMNRLPQPWSAALDTMFSGWIYDHLKPNATPFWLRACQSRRWSRTAPDSALKRVLVRFPTYHALSKTDRGKFSRVVR